MRETTPAPQSGSGGTKLTHRRRSVRFSVALSRLEVEALLAVAGNIDPCMFEEIDSIDRGAGKRLAAAWESGQEKLREALSRVPENSPNSFGNTR